MHHRSKYECTDGLLQILGKYLWPMKKCDILHTEYVRAPECILH